VDTGGGVRREWHALDKETIGKKKKKEGGFKDSFQLIQSISGRSFHIMGAGGKGRELYTKKNDEGVWAQKK